jgi:hypothetical protein
VIPSAGLNLTVEFTHYLDWSALGFTIGFGYTMDGGATWTTLWSAVDPPGNIGPETQTFPSVPGNANFQLGAWFSGYSYNLDWWYIDNVYACYIIPVELTSFTANVNNDGNVVLNWSTATEVNNQMFEVERKNKNGQYATIGYVNGYGTTTEPQEYFYIDNTIESGSYLYRLKQIDFGGQYEYSDEIEVEVNGPLTFTLEQNYPNPFNPSTNIKYSVPETGKVRLAVYNLIGEEVAVLVDGFSETGFYEVTFDASSLPSGAYFYKLQSGNSVVAKKMLFMK